MLNLLNLLNLRSRFDVHVDLAFPDEAARRQVALDALATIPLNYDQDAGLASPDAVTAFVAKHTSGRSAGDISALFREAAMATLREELHADRVAMKHITSAITPDTAILNMRGNVPPRRRNGDASMRFRRERSGRPGGRNVNTTTTSDDAGAQHHARRQAAANAASRRFAA